jgi:hypothetical protein
MDFIIYFQARNSEAEEGREVCLKDVENNFELNSHDFKP